MKGLIYLALKVLLIVWPGVTLALFMDRAFVGDEQGFIRVVGLTVVVIGWLYLFGGRSGARQFVAASVVDRLVFVPIVVVPLAIAGVFPHLLLAFTFSICRSPSVHGCFSVERRDSRKSLSVAILSGRTGFAMPSSSGRIRKLSPVFWSSASLVPPARDSLRSEYRPGNKKGPARTKPSRIGILRPSCF
jgi:hypothetical protein